MATEQNQLQIDGEHTTATVMTDQFDENCGEQIQEMVDHEAFQNDVAIMPDCHYGSGAVIGFTMPVGERVVPNTVGVDIGCGMFALNLGKPLYLRNGGEDDFKHLDEEIRDAVPMGRSVFNYEDQDYHIVDDFPWDECQETLETFAETQGIDISDFDGYGKDYFLNTCAKVGAKSSRAINSLGTLGGGNHFVEISQSTRTGDYWVTVHSGSRSIGLKIAKYWQDRATHLRSVQQVREYLQELPDDWNRYLKFDLETVSDEDLLNWVQGGMGEDFVDFEALKDDYLGDNSTRIDSIRGNLKEATGRANTEWRNTDLDYLEGEEAVGYFIDMIFAQKYASESRKQMAHAVADVLEVDPLDSIESTHNYVDFRDGVIRKGATRAHEGERLIIPFNMRDGTIVCEGKGNPEWNYSAPHGAGRRMSRTRAFNELSLDSFREEMEGIFFTSVTAETLDEAPMAYKETAVVESVVDETADIVDRWEPVHNIKAEE